MLAEEIAEVAAEVVGSAGGEVKFGEGEVGVPQGVVSASGIQRP